jgi:hypothetical protein
MKEQHRKLVTYNQLLLLRYLKLARKAYNDINPQHIFTYKENENELS